MSRNELIAILRRELRARALVRAVRHREEHRRRPDRIHDRQDAAHDKQEGGEEVADVVGDREHGARYTSTARTKQVPATRSLFGFHAVTARLRQRPEAVHALYVQSGPRRSADARPGRTRGGVARSPSTSSTTRASTRSPGHGRHQGVVAIVDDALPHVTLDDVLDAPAEPPLLLVLDGVTDPHNLGACLRSADAFGAHGGRRAQGPCRRRQCDRGEGGVRRGGYRAGDRRHEPRARRLRELKERDVWVVGADAGGEPLHEADLAGPIAWVLGAEGAGLRRLTRESCDRIVGIPLTGSVESLNVSVAAGICLYATRAARGYALKIRGQPWSVSSSPGCRSSSRPSSA